MYSIRLYVRDPRQLWAGGGVVSPDVACITRSAAISRCCTLIGCKRDACTCCRSSKSIQSIRLLLNRGVVFCTECMTSAFWETRECHFWPPAER
eukprot:29507-Eustigmatos_ZCMA.PRE.1